MKEALEKAIEGGWKPKDLKSSKTARFPSWVKQAVLNRSKFFERYLLDPLFWQGLARARGKIDEKWPNGEMRCKNVRGRCESVYCEYGGYEDPYDPEYEMIRHINKGGDLDSFFKQLLK